MKNIIFFASFLGNSDLGFVLAKGRDGYCRPNATTDENNDYADRYERSI